MSPSVKVETVLTPGAFAAFSRFNAFRLHWRGIGLCLFPLVMALMGAVHLATGSPGLFFLFCALGVLLPVGYLAFFFIAVHRQIEIHQIREPRVVYRVSIGEGGVSVSNDREQAEYGWDHVFRAYLTEQYAYLYITNSKAFILPYTNIVEGSREDLDATLRRGLGAARVRNLRRKR